MKRDMEMIRQILIDMEAHDKVDDVLRIADAYVAYQVSLMKEAGLIDAVIIQNQMGLPSQAALMGITWAGHDFLDASRDSTLWKKAVEHIIKPGASWSFSILVEWLKQEARRRLLGVQTSSCDSIPGNIV
jgi:hypothetical protein